MISKLLLPFLLLSSCQSLLSAMFTMTDAVAIADCRDIVRDSTACDIILFPDGSRLSVKVLLITETNVQFKYCDNLKGPTSTLPKSSIAQIFYPNGTSDRFSAAAMKPANNVAVPKPPAPPTERVYVERKKEPQPPMLKNEKPAEGVGLGAFLFMCVGYGLLFAKKPFSLAFFLLGILLGFWSWYRINKSKGKYGQLGWGYTAIVFGVLGCLMLLLLVGL